MNSERIYLLFIIAAYVFSPPLASWWTGEGSQWYRPFLVWSVFIILTAALHYIGRQRRP